MVLRKPDADIQFRQTSSRSLQIRSRDHLLAGAEAILVASHGADGSRILAKGRTDGYLKFKGRTGKPQTMGLSLWRKVYVPEIDRTSQENIAKVFLSDGPAWMDTLPK
jgi:hypothetical protein